MWEDEIVEEVRKVRDECAAKFNYDLEAIYKDIREQEEQSQRRVISLPPKKPELVTVEKSEMEFRNVNFGFRIEEKVRR